MSAEDKILFQRLDVDNYATWRTQMKFLLITKGLWTAVLGSNVDEDKDARALAQIGLHVKEHHLPLLENCPHKRDKQSFTNAFAL
jgi:hypothetical protein